MPQSVLDCLKDAANELTQILDSFSEERLNISPFEGSWTGGQVAEHLLKSNAGVLKVLYSAAGKTQRQADEKVPEIKKLFLDFSLKFKSAEEIMPSDIRQEKSNLLNALSSKFSALFEAAEILDLSEICLDFNVPTFGLLTRLEWMFLVCYHTKRHIFQLEDILQKTRNYNYSVSEETP